jgi:molybdate transport system substrate-binding protein
MRSRTLALLGLAVTGAALMASPAAARPSGAAPRGGITVAAASSLTEAFTAIGKAFHARYPHADVALDFGASSTLATQLEQGAPVDVFASADTASMKTLVAADAVRGTPVVFARNRLAIAVERGNPKHIRTLADTLRPGVQLVLCAPEVPCGRYALAAYRKAGVDVPRVPTGLSAKDTLAKVALGEADAAVVYVTDVEAARHDVDAVKIPTRDNVVAEYPIAVVAATTNRSTANAFVRYARSEAAQPILRRFGFLAP